MTNDFIALLKDSSLVSVLTVMELTKQTQIFATNLGSWVIPGTLCAGALPGDVAAARRAAHRRLERRWKADDVSVERPCRAPRVRDVRLRRGSRQILRGVSFRDRPGETRRASWDRQARARPRSCGQSPGLEPLNPVEIRVEGGRVGMVFQFHCLFEHLSALDNVCLAPVHAHMPAQSTTRSPRARELLTGRSASTHRESALPRELSGGEAQRVVRLRARSAVDPARAACWTSRPPRSIRSPDGARRAAHNPALARAAHSVVATHDEEFARSFATRTLRLVDEDACGHPRVDDGPVWRAFRHIRDRVGDEIVADGIGVPVVRLHVNPPETIRPEDTPGCPSAREDGTWQFAHVRKIEAFPTPAAPLFVYVRRDARRWRKQRG